MDNVLWCSSSSTMKYREGGDEINNTSFHMLVDTNKSCNYCIGSTLFGHVFHLLFPFHLIFQNH